MKIPIDEIYYSMSDGWVGLDLTPPKENDVVWLVNFTNRIDAKTIGIVQSICYDKSETNERPTHIKRPHELSVRPPFNLNVKTLDGKDRCMIQFFKKIDMTDEEKTYILLTSSF